MAGHSTVRSALRLSAICVAAGTILGLSATAAAQSRVQRAERALERAQQELDAARRESAASANKTDQKVEIQCELACPGACEDCDGQAGDDEGREIEITASLNDDDQPRTERRIERRVVVGGGDGHVCPACGRPMDGGDAPRIMQFRGSALPGGVWHGTVQGGQPHIFRMDGGEPQVQTRGKVIILDQDGQRREFDIGGQGAGGQKHIEIRGLGGEGAHGGAQWFESDGGQKKIVIRRQGGEGGMNQPHNMIWLDGEGQAPAGGSNQHIKVRRLGGEGVEGLPGKMGWIQGEGADVTGKVIIVGPDGQRQEFDLGGKGNTGGKDASPRRAPRVQIQEFRDGDASGAHPQQEGERRVIKLHKVSRGQAF